MDLFNFPAEVILGFLLTVMRVSIVLFMMPVFSSDRIPMQVKAAASLVLTLGIWPHVTLNAAHMPIHPFSVALYIADELLLGLILGMSVNFLFMGIQAGGELLGFQMGFTMIHFVDPLTGNQTGFTAFFLWMVSILTFLCLDGHLYMIHGFIMTFKLIPPGGLVLGELIFRQVIELSTQLFILALHIAAPVMVALFLVELTLALVSRTSPQMHIMEVGFPAKIATGFFFLGLLLTIMGGHIETFIVSMPDLFKNLLHTVSPLFQGVR